jgi:hypothetical protein
MGKFAPCDEPGREVFAIERSAQQMTLEGEVLPDRTEARQEGPCMLRIAKYLHAPLALPRWLLERSTRLNQRLAAALSRRFCSKMPSSTPCSSTARHSRYRITSAGEHSRATHPLAHHRSGADGGGGPSRPA